MAGYIGVLRVLTFHRLRFSIVWEGWRCRTNLGYTGLTQQNTIDTLFPPLFNLVNVDYVASSESLSVSSFRQLSLMS